MIYLIKIALNENLDNIINSKALFSLALFCVYLPKQ